MEQITDANGHVVTIHDASACSGDCPFHNPTEHRMVGWPVHVRLDAFAYPLVERYCDHGIGHPDPDSAAYLDAFGPEGARGSWGLHGCDGCCWEPA